MSYVSLSGELLMVNQKLCDIVGYSKDEMLKMTYRDITYSEDLNIEIDQTSKLLKKEIQNFYLEKRYIKKDYSVIWVNLTISLVNSDSGDPLYFSVVTENIDHRKCAEEKLITLQDKMRELVEKRNSELQSANKMLDDQTEARKVAENERNNFFELTNELVAIIDFDGRVISINPAFQRELGYSDVELFSRPIIEFVHPEDLKKTLDIGELLRDQNKMLAFENRYICKDGSTILLSWSGTRVPSEKRTYVTARNITLIRQQEDELAKQKIKMAGQYKMKALGEMAAGIAHEINNPLTIVYGHTSTLKKIASSVEIDRTKLIETSEAMAVMCRRIVDTISGLRTFSRDGSQDRLEFCSMTRLVDETVSFCSGKIQSLGIGISFGTIPADCNLFCRPSQISQVLLNLLNNAKDAAMTAKEKWIKIEFVKSDLQIGLAVIDSGSGVPEEIGEKLFQPFFTTKKVGEGTGLGLSVSKGIVDAHNGQIYLDRSSAFTKFVFTVPVFKK